MNKGVDQIIARIAQDIEKLKNGKLSVSELNDLTNLSRDLYEILLVTRYQKLNGKNESTASVEESIPEAIIQEENTAPEPNEKIADLLFDFSGETEVTAEETEKPMFDLNTIAQEEEQTTPNIEERVVTPQEPAKEIDASLNTNYQDKFSNSIANKMQLSPISNLSGHISLNQRFSFIANLFKNNADAYNSTVSAIDKMSNGNEARETLNSLQIEYNWDLENKEVIDFVTLVERRFI